MLPYGSSRGYVDLLVLLVAIALGTVIAGGLLINFFPQNPTSNPTNGLCCDTGSGQNCKPQTNKTITFSSPTSLTYPALANKPVQYDLLKSNAILEECTKHMKDSGQTVTYPDGQKHPIIINDSQNLAGTANECPVKGYDQLADLRTGHTCVPVDDDELVYVCVKNCMPPYGNTPADTSCDSTTNEYYGQGYNPSKAGNTPTEFDVYYRDQDSAIHANQPANPQIGYENFNQYGVSDVIANCKETGSVAPTTLIHNPWLEHRSLQLHTFNVSSSSGQAIFPRNFCKPALYVYPPKPEDIHVAIAPKGKLLYTNPTYPQNGWDIFAKPNGQITYQNKPYDYLFYEAQIPDAFIPQQNKGYSVKYTDLASFFNTELPKFGLNTKEQKQFTDYWLNALPKAPYYKISLVPDSLINGISPLTIKPKPDSILRLDLNFEPMDKPITISPPIIQNFSRTGFTVIEWGGLFKQDSKHTFTCLM